MDLQCLHKSLLSLDWPDVAACHDDVIEPNCLAVLPVLLGGVALVIAVVFEPKAIHFQVQVVAPADAGEFSDQFTFHPHGLLAIGLVWRGIRLDYEFPALPLTQRRNDTVLPGIRALTRSRWKEAIAPVFVHLQVRFHVEVVSVEIHLTRWRILAPCEPRL